MPSTRFGFFFRVLDGGEEEVRAFVCDTQVEILLWNVAYL